VKYRKRPVEIEAVRFDGSTTQKNAILYWMDTGEYIEPSVQTRDLVNLYIFTLEGTMTANPGDWIIRGVQGEFYPCKPDIFEATYEEA
jgi:hypothetical protein